MLAARLVNLIEARSQQLSEGLLKKLLASERTADLRRVPEGELAERTYEIYRNLSDWLLTKTEDDIERRYTEIGARRAQQGVAFSHFLWAIVATKAHLHEFLRREGLVDTTVELIGEVELLQALDQFFDRALYYASVGYERARNAKAA
ncbi:MAG: hypothetical protein ACRD2Y_03595 [Terriglobales bacterium]